MIRQEQLTPPAFSVIATTTLIGRRWMSERAFEVELTRPENLVFEPGHTIRLICKNHKRYYSLVSKPNDPTLKLCVKFLNTGGLSSILATSQLRAQFEMTGPHGYFTFTPSPRPPVFIATDTGIAPFVSMARSGIRHFILLHAARRTEELYYQDIFQQAACQYLPCVCDTPDDNVEVCEQYHRKMVDLLKTHLKPGRYDFYLCGWHKMVKEATQVIDACYPYSHVYTEVFY